MRIDDASTFQIHITIQGESAIVGYGTADAAAGDGLLETLLTSGAVMSLWRGDDRLSGDIRDAETLRAQLAENAWRLEGRGRP